MVNPEAPVTLICHLPLEPPVYLGLRQGLAGLKGADLVEHFGSPQDLGQRLHDPGPKRAVALVAARDSDQLEEITQLAPLLDNIPLVLLVPDDQDSSLAQGHKLKPRLVAEAESDPQEVLAVVENLLRRVRWRN